MGVGLYGSSDRYDFDLIVEWSIKAQQAAINAHYILAIARIERHVRYLEKKTKGD